MTYPSLRTPSNTFLFISSFSPSLDHVFTFTIFIVILASPSDVTKNFTRRMKYSTKVEKRDRIVFFMTVK